MNNIFSKLLFISVLATCLTGQLFAQAKSKTAVKKAPARRTAAAILQSLPTIEPWRQLNTKERLVEITTDYGVMIAKLYDSTPLHRDNFVKLVEQKFYDSLLFHRVINQFMIQGGDPTSKTAPEGAHLGSGSIAGDRIPAEFKPYFFHKKGALAAARDDNPAKASSNCQFYIVQGKTMAPPELENVYMQRVKPSNPSFNYTTVQKEVYSRIGGTPFLDQSYTIFGEVISGLDVIDKVARAPKDESDRPLQNIRMKIRLLN
jgi:cyclophilin family peptidyl-prolyl cis-trans isomerase